jgi:hypothetical protein
MRLHRFFPFLFVTALGALPLAAAPKIGLARHAPCNLFELGQPVALQAKFQEFPAGAHEALAVVTDYEGREVLRKSFPLNAEAGKAAELSVDLGQLGRGYYEVKLSTANPAFETKATLGVIEFQSRTGQQVREGGYKFGLKWWGGVTAKEECVKAMTSLGLQWTRLGQTEKGEMPPERMVTEFPMNAVLKVERFPKDIYDEERYGPLAEWEAKYGKGAWVLKTLPKKEPYQQYLRENLAKFPPHQQVFEIWNEPWDKMSPEDFAQLSQWILEVIEKERPGAIVGPNLLGNMSPYEYDARVIKAGGLKGMKMVALHPYASSENREWLRKYRAWLKEQTGTDMDIHITEYGSHSTPEGPAKRTEQEQAERVVRQSLALYAEGVTSMEPHWLGQTEAIPTYIEDWFGFVRKNEQVKPVMIAYANCARLIDSTTYVGDLWFGQNIGAMLFEKNGTRTLALWTQGEPLEAEVDAAAPEVELVQIDGRAARQPTQGGKLRVKLTQAPVYLVGVGAELVAQASKELRADRFPEPEKAPRVNRTAKRLNPAPKLDGKFDDWAGAAELGMVNPKVAGLDCSGTGYVSWDAQFLYLAVDIRDNEILNNQPRAKLYRQDSLEAMVSLEPRESGSGHGPRDFQLFITPKSGEGKAIVGFVTDREAGVVEDVKGAESHVGPGNNGWVAEVAIPWAAFTGGFEPKDGAKLALEFRVNDADTSHERFKIDPLDVAAISTNDPSTWSYLILKD